jgi:hypothetical protein
MFSDHLPDTCVSVQRRSNGTSVSNVVAAPPFFYYQMSPADFLILPAVFCIQKFFLFCFWFWPFFRLLIVSNHNNKKGNNTNNAEKEGFWNNVDPYSFHSRKFARKRN